MWSRRKLAVLVTAGAVALAGCGGQEAEPADDGLTTAPAEDSVLTFTATTVAGEEFAAADLAGRPAVFWFWAPWCSTCVAEAPHVLDLVDEHGDAVNVVGVASLGEPPEMEDFIELTDTGDLTHLNDRDGDVWRLFEITEQSTFALVDADGVVTHAGFLGPDELAEQVVELAG